MTFNEAFQFLLSMGYGVFTAFLLASLYVGR